MVSVSIVVMGVAGCGKTTIGKHLAQELGYPFFDGDDFHPEANVQKMSRGEPLNDDDREGWLKTLQQLIQDNESKGITVIVACSALKARYRDHLRTNDGPLFVYLNISKETAEARLKARTNHFMPVSLVASQFEALQAPQGAINIDANHPQDQVQREVMAQVAIALGDPT